MAGLARLRRVGRRKQPAPQCIVIEHLAVWQHRQADRLAAYEIPHAREVEFLVPDLGVIGGEGLQKRLVVAQKRRGIDVPVVPDQREPAAGLQNARKFRARPVAVEPVERLRGGDEIDTPDGQRRCLRRAVDTDEVRVVHQCPFARRAHLGVRFDAVESARVRQQHRAENPRARADVSHHRTSPQRPRPVQHVQHLRRITRAKPDVILDPARKAARGIRAHGPRRSGRKRITHFLERFLIGLEVLFTQGFQAVLRFEVA